MSVHSQVLAYNLECLPITNSDPGDCGNVYRSVFNAQISWGNSVLDAALNGEYPCSTVYWTSTATREDWTVPTFTLSDGYPRATTSILLSIETNIFSDWNYRCNEPTEPIWTTSCTAGCGKCTIGKWNDPDPLADPNAIHVRLIHWAYEVTSTPGVENENLVSPRIAVDSGYTFTSPTIYLSIMNVVATDRCGYIGNRYSNIILPLSSGEVSTISFPNVFTAEYQMTSATESLNLSILNGPIPISAWTAQQGCGGDLLNPNCLPIIDASYEPLLIVPSQVLLLDPAWATCELDWEGFPDPPYALTAMDPAVMQTTVGGMPTPGQAKPGSTKGPGLAPLTTGGGASIATDSPKEGAGDPSDQSHLPADPKPGDPLSQPGHQDPSNTILPSNSPSPIYPTQKPRPGLDSPLPTVGPFPVSIQPDGGVQIGGSTVFHGGPAQTFGSNTISLADDGALWVGSKGYSSIAGFIPKVHQIAGPETDIIGGGARSFARVGGLEISRDAKGGIFANGRTVVPGRNSIMISGHEVSMNSVGTAIKIDSKWFKISDLRFSSSAQAEDALGLITIGSRTFTANADGHYLIDGQTLTQGGTVMLSGTKISLASDGSKVVVGTSTEDLSGPTTVARYETLTFNGKLYAADSAGEFVINGQTIYPGQITTIFGTRISLAGDDSFVVIGGSTQYLHPSTTSYVGEKVMTFRGGTYTADTNGDFVIAGNTLRPGQLITVSGTQLSLASNGGFVVIGGNSTESLMPVVTDPVGLGSIIMDGFRGDANATGAVEGTSMMASVIEFEGTARRRASPEILLWSVILLTAMFWI